MSILSCLEWFTAEALDSLASGFGIFSRFGVLCCYGSARRDDWRRVWLAGFRAATVAENVMGAITEEARKQGLTAEGAKSAVGDVSAKVGRVVDAAGKGISERVTSTKSS